MAKARMLHNKISKSLQVDELPLPAQLLFSWMISWADDEGRIRGEPKYIKGTVVPLKNWSLKHIERYLQAMRNLGLIYYWSDNNEQYIEFVKWNEHQQIRKDRLIKSTIPSFKSSPDNQSSTISQPSDNQKTEETNISKSNSVQYNLNPSELKGVQPIADTNIPYKGSVEEGGNSTPVSEENPTADNFISKGVVRGIHPKSFEPQSNEELQALETWKRLEPDRPYTFYPTFLSAVNKGLPANKFGEFASEIEQDNTIRNRGQVFNKKVKDYLESKDSPKIGGDRDE